MGKCNIDHEDHQPTHSAFPTTSAGGRYGQNILSDVWETVNAKLHYEKHLIEMREGGSVFGEDTASSVAVEEGYSDFGEPKASPRVVGKQSTSNHHHHRFSNHSSSGEQLNESFEASGSPVGRSLSKRSSDVGKDRPHRTCFAVGTEGTTSNDHLFAGINGSISSGCGFEFSPERVETEAHRKQFLSQRAGHYNEYLVLKAMRAKLEEEDDEDDD